MATLAHDIPQDQSEDVGLLHGHHASTSNLTDNSSRDRDASSSYYQEYHDHFTPPDKNFDSYPAEPGSFLNDRPYDSDPSSYGPAVVHKEDEEFGMYRAVNFFLVFKVPN